MFVITLMQGVYNYIPETNLVKVVKLSASRTGRLYPQEMFLVLIFTRG